jgi:hypothetical protein
MKTRILSIAVLFAVLAAPLAAQTTTVQATDLSTGSNVTRVGDATNNALRVSQAGSWLVSGIVSVSQSGTWTVQPGNTANTTAWLVNGTGGTFPVTDNAGSLTVDAPVGTPVFVRLSDGSSAIATLPVSLASVPSHAVTNAGTFLVQAAQSGTWTVTGAGGTFPVTGTFWQATQPISAAALPLPSGASTLAEQQTQTTALQLIDNLPNTQGSTTSGQSGVLVQGAVTTAAPSYTTAQTSPLSLTTAGALRVDASATTQPISGNITCSNCSGSGVSALEDAASANGDAGTPAYSVRQDTPAGSTSADGDYQPLKTDSVGRLWVNCGTGCAGGTQYAEDSARSSGDTVTLAGAVRQDTLSSDTSADGDASFLKVTSAGRLYTSATIDAALPAGANAIGQVTANAGTNLNTSALALESGGNLATLAGVVTSSRAAVNPISGQAGVAGGSGTVGATTQRVVLATDVALPAGTNVIGALSANQSVNVAQIAGTTTSTGNGTSGAGVQRVTIASDSTYSPVLGAGTAQIGTVGLKPTYGAKQTITWTGTSLANGSAREATVIDWTSTRCADARIRIQSKGQASGTNFVDWYVYTALGDTTYTDGATGSDAPFTAASRLNSRFLGSLKLNAATDQRGTEFQLSDIFRSMPDKWGLIGINNSGAALSATAGDHVLEYECVN